MYHNHIYLQSLPPTATSSPIHLPSSFSSANVNRKKVLSSETQVATPWLNTKKKVLSIGTKATTQRLRLEENWLSIPPEQSIAL